MGCFFCSRQEDVATGAELRSVVGLFDPERSVGVVGAAVWSVGLAHPVVGLGAESSATGLLWWAFVLELGGFARSRGLVRTGARQVGG